MIGDEKKFVMEWVESERARFSEYHSIIWNYGETAFREYRSAAWYVDLLRREGFAVEEGSAGMPTAFCATWSNGDGPVIGGYAEYDGIPGNCQAADTVRRPRDGLSPLAGGHTDPHSILGISSLGGFLAAKAAMEKFNITGKLKFFGEPAEKLRASKPIHAAKGYYDDLDAAFSFHPFYMLPLCNTTRWDTHCGTGYNVMYTFECPSPETWISAPDDSPIPASHSATRCPGATDAVIHMYTMAKMAKEHMISNNVGWSLNETITLVGQATADNIPAHKGQIHYMIRVPDEDMAETVVRILDKTAEAAALATHCTWRRDWIAKSRRGLPNHVMADATYKNLELAGPPVYSERAREYAREIQKNLGFDPMPDPFIDEIQQLITPQDCERELRKMLPEWQENFTSDDYTDYCWHAPTVRLYVGRPALRPPAPGQAYPAWVMNALGGIPECIDPTFVITAKTIGMTICDLLTKPDVLEKAKAEFVERTGGGVGGSKWVPCLCDYEPPIDFPWPEYVTTARGENQWWIPAKGDR